MSTDNTERFSQQRKIDAMSYNSQAEQLYESYYDVTLGDVYPVETIHDDGIEDPYQLRPVIQQLDFAGIDCIINVGSRLIPLAQRFRPGEQREQVDFSLRYDTGTPMTAEYVKLQRDGLKPLVYAFGITDDSDGTFSNFYLIDVPALVTAMESTSVDEQGPYPSGGGTKGMYYEIAELQSSDCILQSWDSDEIETILTKEE